MLTYHGTSKQNAKDIIDNGVNISLGGGELGKGFYVGDLLHRAAAWAWNKYNSDLSVLIFDVDDSEFLKLDLLVLDFNEAYELRKRLKRKGLTRKYSKGVDAIWAPIVGQKIPYFNQIKFEKSGKCFIDSVPKMEWKIA